MVKSSFALLLVFLLSLPCKAQMTQSTSSKEYSENPKLVVGIVIDQMRYDYLTRFYNKFGDDGFKRMINEGFNCKNNHFNYAPTKTGPGHASIFTGTTPKYHGIIGNDWFDKKTGKSVYCVEDDSVMPLGTKSNDGKMSPHRMLTTTFGDENRLFTQMRGKTIGISIKHRSAILPAGHAANAAYWFDYEHNGTGNWISSTYYMKDLPKWVKDFNASRKVDSYWQVWNTIYPIETYTESGSDLNTFERIYNGRKQATFPYDLNALKSQNENYKLLAESPFGNTMITDFTIAALKNEDLGKDDITDVLTVSYTSTDKVGHDFGPNSKEVEDTYIRLDLELARLFKALDEQVGKGEYTVFLTADHGAPNVPRYLLSKKIPAGLFDEKQMKKDLNSYLEKMYKLPQLVLSVSNDQIFFDHQKINSNQLDLSEIKTKVADTLLHYRLIDKVYNTSDINQFEGPSGYIETMLANGHNQKRSGDMLFVYDPEVFKDNKWNRTGTDHHSTYNYDTHVPLLFFGKGIKHGATFERTAITDIAPTMSALLNISFPNAAIGNPLTFVLK